MPTPPHYSPLLFFSPWLVECIPHQVISRVTMSTSAEDSFMSLVSGDVKTNFVFLSAYTYLIATLLSILVHDRGLELDSLLFDENSGGNLWSMPSAKWVDKPTFMLIASISCQHPHIIHRSYSSLHDWWSAFLTRWFVEWRCGQVPRIRLCLWWVEMSINFVFLSAATYLIATLLSILVHDGGLELDSLLFDWNYGGNLWSVPSAMWVDTPTFMLIASISCQHPHIIHRSYSSLHVWWSAFLTRWFVEWPCGQVPRIRLCLWWVEMSKLILCFWVVLAYTYLIATLHYFLSILCMILDWNWILYFLVGTLEEICGVCLLQRELTRQLLCWLLANTSTLFTALILLSMSVGVHSSPGDL